MQGHTANLGDAVAAPEQRPLAEARRMTRRRRLAADVGEDVARRLPAFAKRNHYHRTEGLPACRIGNRGVIPRGISPGPTGDASNLIAWDPTALQLDRQSMHQGIGSDTDGCDYAAGLDP